MKKTLIVSLGLSLLSALAYGQGSNPNDTFKIGQASSSADKGLIFDTNDGANNKKLVIEKSSKLLKFDGNSLQIGDGAANVKSLLFNGTSGKSLNWDSASTEFQFNDDLGITAGNKLKVNSIDTISGTEISAEKLLRAKLNLKLGTGTVGLRDNAGKLEYTNDGTIYKKVVSGGGGAGAISILDNGGFEDGISSGWSFTGSTVTAVVNPNALVGDTSAQFDPAALNDYYRTSYITVPKGLRGAACEARFLYTGSDRNVYAKVETESGVVLGTYIHQDGLNGIPSHSISGYESVFYKCPTEADITALTTNGNIRLVLYQGTASNAALGVFDDVHFGGLTGLVESGSPDNFGGYVSNAGTYLNGYGGVITGCSVASDVKTCNFQGLTVSPSCTIMPLEGNTNSLSMKITGLSNTFISFASLTPSTNTATALDLILQCSKAGADAKQSVQVYKSIPKVAQNINDFTAYVDAAGTVTAETADFINGNAAISATSTFTFDFVSGIFTAVPACFATSVDNGTTIASNITTTSTQTIVRVLNSSTNANQAGPFYLYCRKNGPDFKMPTVQPMVIGQVTNSVAESALNNVRIESCRIGNGGAFVIDGSSGMCDSWIASGSRTSAGVTTLNLKPVFSSTPVCVLQIDDQSNTMVVRNAVSGTAGTGFILNPRTINLSNALDDYNYSVICMGKR